jgi:hypothetical protein
MTHITKPLVPLKLSVVSSRLSRLLLTSMKIDAEELSSLISHHDAYNETRVLEAECRALEAEQTIARMKIDAEELSRLISHHETCVLEAELRVLEAKQTMAIMKIDAGELRRVNSQHMA